MGKPDLRGIAKDIPASGKVRVTVPHITHAELAGKLKDLGAQCYCGPAGLVEMVRRDDIDIVVAAIVGSAGLPATLATVESGKTLALANKESLVVAGSLVIPLARKKGVAILPVDSEHSAVFQALHCGRAAEVKRVILTASGGPFRKATREQIEKATLTDALKHPTWRMGRKCLPPSAAGKILWTENQRLVVNAGGWHDSPLCVH